MGPITYQRALDYYERGMVLGFYIDKLRIRAFVQGAGGRNYDVEIQLTSDGGIGVSYCGCAFYSLCEHIGAVLLKYIDDMPKHFFESKEQEEYEEVIPLKNKGNIDNFLIRRLQLLQDRSSKSGPGKEAKQRFKLFFAMEYKLPRYTPEAYSTWMLRAVLRNVKVNGGYGPWRVFNYERLTEPVTEKEKVLLDKLAQKEKNSDFLDHYFDFLLVEPDIEIFLKLRQGYKKLQFVPIDRVMLRFKFSGLHGKEPVFLPILDFYDESALRSSLAVPHNVSNRGLIFYIVDMESGSILYKRLAIEFQRFLSELVKEPGPYNFSDICYLADYIEQNHATSLQIELPAGQVRILRKTPVPILELKDMVNRLYLSLLFNYEGRIFPYRRQEELLILEKDEDEFLVVERNKVYEQNCFFFLLSLFPEEMKRQAAGYSSTGQFLFVERGNLETFLLNYGQKLLDEGFELRKKGKKIRRIDRLSITVSRNMDWLDLQVDMVDENGKNLPLQVDPDLFEGSFIKTDDSYYLLREKDIARLKELYRLGLDNKGLMRVSRHHYFLIDELYEDIKNREDSEVLRMKRTMDGLKEFKRIPKVSPPKKFRGVLRDYQKAGLNWLHFLYSYGVNGCLADDMGLGKTVQTLALLQRLKNDDKLDKALIVVPVSTLANWEEEIKRFTPFLRVVSYCGPQRSKHQARIDGADIILISYHTLRNDIKIFSEHDFTYLILDESQTIKNPSSQIHKCVRLISSAHRLSLTGTPVENNITELWAQMNFLNPGLLGSLRSFRQSFARPIEEKESAFEMELLKKTVFPFILRRKKEDVLDDLPPKEEIILYTEMGSCQQKAYNEIREYYREKVTRSISEKGVGQSAVVIFEALLKLRQAAIFPSLASDRYSKVSSCKFELLQIVLEEILSQGHKVLIFSQFLGSLSFIKEWVRSLRVGYAYLDGSTKDRAAQIESFQTDDKKRVFLISLKAGGLGINLTAADYVILFDPWWNPAVETQAVDRSHRIGRQNKVIAYKIITRNTVEEKILALQKKKKRLVEEVITAEKAFFKSLTREDILRLFN